MSITGESTRAWTIAARAELAEASALVSVFQCKGHGSELVATLAIDPCSGRGSLNRFSASLSGVSAGVRLPCGWAAG